MKTIPANVLRDAMIRIVENKATDEDRKLVKSTNALRRLGNIGREEKENENKSQS